MSEIDRYIRKAIASKRADFALPVIDSPEDAMRVIRAVAARLPTLPENEQLVLLSDLAELSSALAARVERLDREMARDRVKIHEARFGRRVCASYARHAGVVVQLNSRRRPPPCR